PPPARAPGPRRAAVAPPLALPLLSREPGPDLGFGEIAAVATGSAIGASLCAIIGVAAGALGRNQIVGVVGTLVLMFVAMPLLNIVDKTAAEVTPFGAAVVLAGEPSWHPLSWGAAGLVLAAWTVPLLLAAIVVERRRDLA